jgi:hypothetical protein
VTLGEKRLGRIHFARLTSVDTDHGHAAILRLHEKMGARDHDWEVLGKVLRFLWKDGRVARVRKLRRKDAAWAIAAVPLGLLFFAAGIGLAVFMVDWSMKSHWTAMTLRDFNGILITGAYASLLGAIGLFAFHHVGRYRGARALRRKR